MAAIKVLMADDEPAVLDIMARKVTDAGFDVITASGGEEAWDKIQKENPDVVLLDLMMPQMDGLSVLSKMRQDQSSRKWVPVIVISALGEMKDLQKTFDLQADHYLIKPCRLEDILKSIRLMVSLVPLRTA